MKIPVKAAIFLTCIIFMILIIMAITSTSARTTEGEKSLAAAVEQSMKQIKAEEGYSIENYEEWLADFSQDLLKQVSSDSDINVDVLAADVADGVLDILVTEKYMTVNGKEKEAACRKTVLFEEYDKKKEYCTISFEAGGSIFRQFSQYEGDSIIDPGIPEMEGRTFRNWVLEGSAGPADISSMAVDGDMVFRAEFE